MGFLSSLFRKKEVLAPTAEPARLSSVSKSIQYSDIGPIAGTCTKCGRETYAIAGPRLMRLIFQDEIDKVESNAMWCLKCDALFCMGCAHAAKQKCSKCSGTVGDQYHRQAR